VHVSETYNTIMCLHALGISVDVHISQLSVKTVVILFFKLKYFEKENVKNWYICKNSEYLSVHGVMIDSFQSTKVFECNSNYSLKHVLIDCGDVGDVRPTFYNVNN
jgi:hypothetical protein